MLFRNENSLNCKYNLFQKHLYDWKDVDVDIIWL